MVSNRREEGQGWDKITDAEFKVFDPPITMVKIEVTVLFFTEFSEKKRSIPHLTSFSCRIYAH